MLDGSGNPVISYDDNTNDDLKILHCGDPFCSSSNVITSPDTVDDVGNSTSLALNNKGYPVVSYRDRTNTTLKVLFCGDATCSSSNTIASPDTVGNVGGEHSLALDGNENAVVSYRDNTNDDLKVLHCGDSTCSSGNIITSPDMDGDVGRQPSLALDASGYPVVSYFDFTNTNLKVLHCGDTTCSTGNIITSPDTGGDVGRGSSLVLDGAGNPVVSYQDTTNQDLKVLHCGDPNCSSGNVITSPDTTGDPRDPSLALDGSGNPVIAYSEEIDGDLKVLHCGDPTCSTGNVITLPDTVNQTGEEPSLVLDAVGQPVVSYLYGTDDDLRVLHCGDATCGVPPSPTPSSSPTASSAPTASATATPTPTPTGTPPAGQSVTWADNNCKDGVNPVDSLLVLRGDAGLSANTNECPPMGADIEVLDASPHTWGDVDCKDGMTPVDSLKILRYDAGLSVSQEDGCPEMGSDVTVSS